MSYEDGTSWEGYHNLEESEGGKDEGTTGGWFLLAHGWMDEG